MIQPFARSLAMSSVIAVLRQSIWGSDLNQAIAALGPYKSRGKGRGKYSGKKPGNRTGRTYTSNGVRECARRVRQIEKGMLSCTA